MSTYWTYKAGTKRLTTWLVEAAKLCGVDSTAFARDKYQIPLGKFVELAKTITQSKDPKIKVPDEIVTIAKTVITLRKEAGALFAKLTGTTTKHASQASHRYFITVLETVLKILAPPSSSGTDEDQTAAGADVTNFFAALTVDNPTLDTGAAAPTAAKKKAKKQPSQEYVIQDSSDDELLLAVLGFFQDYTEIEKFVMAAWIHYRDGRLNLMAASVVTDTAYGMLKRSSEDLLSTASGEKRTYWDIVAVFNDDKIFGGKPDIAELAGLGQLMALDVERILSSFSTILQPKKSPIYNGQFGFYQPDSTLTKKTPEEQDLQNQQLLFDFLPEVSKIAKGGLKHLPAEDELTTSLRPMMEHNTMAACPMYAIFATKLFLSVHHVLRTDAVRPFEELQATAKRCIATIDGWLKVSERSQPLTLWPPKNDEWLRRIRTLAKEYVLEDIIGKPKLGVPDKFQPQPFHFMKRNPVYCGLLMLRLNLLLQEGGQTLVGAWGSAIYPIHLYNACRQSGGLDMEWQDAEYIYQLHTPQRIFVGAPPKDPKDYFKRFVLMLGGSVSNFARNRRISSMSTIVESKKGPRGLKTTTPVREILHPRYVADGNAVLSAGNLTALAAIASKAQRMHAPLCNVEKLAEEVNSQPQLTPVQLLTCIQEGIAAEEMHLLFDYFGVHERGIKLLRELQTGLHEDMVSYFGENYIEDDSQLPYMVGYIFNMVVDTNFAAEQLKLQYHGSKILHKASGILKEFLERDNTSMKGLMQARALTRIVQYAHESGQLQNVQIWDPQKRQDARRGGH